MKALGDRIGANRGLSAPKGIRKRLDDSRVLISLIAISLALLNGAASVHLTLIPPLASSTGGAGGSHSVGAVNVVAVGELKRIFSSATLYAEGLRQVANLIVLVSAAVLAGKDRLERFAAFFWLFGTFAVAYCAARYLFLGAPRFFASREILILPFRSLSVSIYLPIAAGLLALVLSSVLYAIRAARSVGRLTL